MAEKQPKIIVSSGEPAGIGPDIVIKTAQFFAEYPLVVVGNADLFECRARQLGLPIKINTIIDANNDSIRIEKNLINLFPVALPQPPVAGQLDARNSGYTINCINRCVDLCLQGNFHAMVTAPVHKAIINDAGIAFSGHTEWIAKRTKTKKPVMMLARESLRVCLATTHLPLKAVTENITEQSLIEIIHIIHADLVALYGIDNPVIGVCGLNPHAGEDGYLGLEEKNVIEPALEALRGQGIDLIGPLPADTAFMPEQLKNFDAVLAMYHDQGLPVIKHAAFGEIVNVTLGLPIIRTSVDHGTALNLAGSGQACESSLRAAIELARKLINNKIFH